MWRIATLVLLLAADPGFALAPPPELDAAPPGDTEDEGEDNVFILHSLSGGSSDTEPRRLSSSRRRSSSSFSSSSSSSENPFMEMLFGFVLWCFIPCFLFNNEKIAVKQAKLQGKALAYAVEVEDINREPIEELNGHILYMSGDSTCCETLSDKFFPNVTVTNCVKLRRVVQMYQWVEKEEKDDDHNKRYTHRLQWSEGQQHCPGEPFGHENPPMPLPSSQRSLDNYRAGTLVNGGSGEPCAEASTFGVRLGAYYLGQFVKRELANWKPVEVDARMLSCAQLSQYGPPPQTSQDGWFHYGPPQSVGAIRVQFEMLQCGPLSLCGVLAHVQGGHTLVPVFREGSFRESCMQEFCCTCECLRPKRLVFGHEEEHEKSDEDTEELIEDLENQESELQDEELNKFLHEKTAYDQKFYQVEQNAMQLCCVPSLMQDKCTGCLHWVGLEEEFLGVIERQVDINEMMRGEASTKDRRHCCARMVGILLGIFASSLIISPITYLLNYNWLISLLGGAALSCLISCLACSLSFFIGLIIIAIAWFNARPRLSLTLFAIAVCCALGGTYFATHGEILGITTTAAPAVFNTLVPT